MNSATEIRYRVAGALLLAMIGTAAGLAAAASNGGPVTARPAELRKILQKAERRLAKAEDELAGKDPGRVSNVLRRLDEELARFLERSGIEIVLDTMARARQAAGDGDHAAAIEALEPVRASMTALTDYILRRDAEVAYRAALRAAQERDLDACLKSIDDLEAAMIAPVLMSRLSAAREAIARARKAMVRRDMPTGRTEAAAVRASLQGLQFAGALSRGLFEVRFTAEFFADGFPTAARHQLRQAIRDLKAALRNAPDPLRPGVEQALSDLIELSGRLSRPDPGDGEKLESIKKTLQTMRAGLG